MTIQEAPPRVLRAAIYCRISRDKEGREVGVGTQRDDGLLLAEKEGWLVTAEPYIDNDMGASTKSRTKRRPAFERMLDAAERGDIDVVIAYSQSRLTRNPEEFERLIRLADHGKVQIATKMSGRFDLTTADGRAVARTIVAWDAAEAERTSERVVRSLQERAVQGRRLGKVPFGWRADPAGGPDVLDEVEAPVVREAVRRWNDGETLYSITNDFRRRGIRSRPGNPLAANAVRLMILRPRNAGLVVHEGVTQRVYGSWPPIITEEEYERAVARWERRRRAPVQEREGRIKHLLSGIAKCGVCGAGLRVQLGVKGKYRWTNYACTAPGCLKVRRKQEVAEALVVEAALGRLAEPDGPRILGGDPEALAAADAAMDELHTHATDLADLFGDRLMTKDDYARQMKRLNEQMDDVRARRAAAEPKGSLARFAGPQAREAWANEMSIEVKRAVLRAMLTVTIHPYASLGAARSDPTAGIEITFLD